MTRRARFPRFENDEWRLTAPVQHPFSANLRSWRGSMAAALGGPPLEPGFERKSVMNFKKTALMAMMGVMLTGIAVTAASADTRWQADHPRRAEVNHRLANQDMRISAERRAGDISARKAHRLHLADRRIARQERHYARFHDGHISRTEQHRLNREENRVSHRIG
jgi:hypothetical protein